MLHKIAQVAYNHSNSIKKHRSNSVNKKNLGSQWTVKGNQQIEDQLNLVVD